MNEVNKDLTHSSNKRKVTPEVLQIILENYPNHSNKEVAEMIRNTFGFSLSTEMITRHAKKHSVKKSKEYLDMQQQKRCKLAVEPMRKAKRNPEFRSRFSAIKKAQYQKERWLEMHGLEKKTNYKVVFDKKMAYNRKKVKHRLVKRRNYFPDEEDQRVLYYDKETQRSSYMEKKYSRMFTFYPAEDFKEEDSVWCKTYKKDY